MKWPRVFAAALALVGSSAAADIVQRTASNGVIVDVGTDSFANLKAISSPIIPFGAEPGGSGKFQVEQRISKGTLQTLTINGYVIYPDDDWRFYGSAIFRGGDAAHYVRSGGEVITCQPTHFSDQKACSFSEDFQISTSADEVAAHTLDGNVEVRVSDQSGETFTLLIPAAYFAAVEEVAKVEAAN